MEDCGEIKIRQSDSRRLMSNLSGLSDEKAFMEDQDKRDKRDTIMNARTAKKSRKIYPKGKSKDKTVLQRLLDAISDDSDSLPLHFE